MIFPYDNSLGHTGVFSFDGNSGALFWSFNTSEANIQQPIIKNGLLLFGASDGSFYSLNPNDGTLNWHVTLASPKEGQWTEAQILDSQIFVGYQDRIYSLDSNTGQLLWNWSTPNGKPVTGQAVSPLSNLLYVTYEQNLQTFNITTGNPEWNQHFDHYIRPPITAYNRVFVAADGYIIAYG